MTSGLRCMTTQSCARVTPRVGQLTPSSYPQLLPAVGTGRQPTGDFAVRVPKSIGCMKLNHGVQCYCIAVLGITRCYPDVYYLLHHGLGVLPPDERPRGQVRTLSTLRSTKRSPRRAHLCSTASRSSLLRQTQPLAQLRLVLA